MFPGEVPEESPRIAAEFFVDCLENEGVEFVFGIPGEETLDLNDALDRSPHLTFVPVRHEQSAAFMADAYGRLTGKPGVCLATLGPGATNLATGIGDANLDNAPLVALTGQVELGGMHKETHQFIDAVEMLRPMTKWNARVHDPRMIGEAVRKAFAVAAAEKPGATHLELPEDVMASPVIGHPMAHAPVAVIEPDAGALQRAAHLLQTATRPVLLVGNGVVRQGASPALRDFCRQTGLHVITTFMGKGVIDSADEHFLFTAGLRAQDYPQGLMGRADLVVCVGYDMVEWPPSAWNPDGRQKIVCIDTVPPEIDAHFVPEVELIGNLSHILTQLGCLLWNKPMAGYEVPPYRRALSVALDVGSDDDVLIKPQRVLYDLRKAMASHDVLDLGRGRAQALDRAFLAGDGAQHRAHQQRVRGDGLRPAGRHRRLARLARPQQGRGDLRRRRLPDERAGAGDGQTTRIALRRPRLDGRRLRPHRDAPAPQVRPGVGHPLRQPGLRRPRAGLRHRGPQGPPCRRPAAHAEQGAEAQRTRRA